MSWFGKSNDKPRMSKDQQIEVLKQKIEQQKARATEAAKKEIDEFLERQKNEKKYKISIIVEGLREQYTNKPIEPYTSFWYDDSMAYMYGGYPWPDEVEILEQKLLRAHSIVTLQTSKERCERLREQILNGAPFKYDEMDTMIPSSKILAIMILEA